jgi:putative endonuclease
MPNLATGASGEDEVALRYSRAGYRLIARNWRCSIGELDLIIERGGTLVFCEVKTRTGSRFGGGYEAVTPRKQQKVRAVAEAFISRFEAAPAGMRFDVASVRIRAGAAQVEIFEDAF